MVVDDLDALGLVGFDVLEAVCDAAADLEVGRPFVAPAPTLQRPRAYRPTTLEFVLVEVPGSDRGIGVDIDVTRVRCC